MPNIDTEPLKRYLPLVDQVVTEKLRTQNRGAIPIAIILGEHEISAGINETFNEDFNLAMVNKDYSRLKDLFDVDREQYNCALLLLVESMNSQMEAQTQGIKDVSERARKRVDLANNARELIKSLPNGEQLITDILKSTCHSQFPLASAFIDQFNTNTGRILNGDKVRSNMNVTVENLPEDEFSKIESELLASDKVISRLGYWKASVISLLESDSALRVGALGVRQGAYVDYAQVKSRNPDKKVLRKSAAAKLQMVNFINDYGIK